jgi:serine/threonine protein kinase
MGVTLGIGSYGKVKSCIDKDINKTFAVKIIPRA